MRDGQKDRCMSNLTAIGLISAVTISSYFTVLRADRQIHERGDAVITGLIRGVHVSIRDRWVILFQHWVPNVAGVMGFSFVLTVAFLAMAQNVNDELVETLAYLCAGLGSFIVIFWLLLGPFYFFYLTSILRQAEAD
jgi:hypothetical protein